MAGTTGTQHLGVIDYVGRCPDDIVVAIFANIGGLDVHRILARRAVAGVTRGAAADDTGMVEVRREPCHRGMAIITVIAAGDVGGILARSDNAVMAGTTGAQHLRVVDHVCRRPQVTVVAVLTDFGGLDMCRVLARRLDAVMAACTVGHNVGVIKSGREPSCRRMTIVAIVAAREVGRVLARGDYAIVARAASTDDLGVIDECGRLPERCAVAIFANIGGLDMHLALADGFHAVVTTETVAGDIRMVENSGSPEGRLVAIVALLTARNVRRILSGGNDAIVAGAAIAGDCRVIHISDRAPGSRCMTVGAEVG